MPWRPDGGRHESGSGARTTAGGGEMSGIQARQGPVLLPGVGTCPACGNIMASRDRICKQCMYERRTE